MKTMTLENIKNNFYTKLNIYSKCLPEHNHSFIEIILFVDGKSVQTINGANRYECFKGDVYLIRPNEYHKVEFLEKESTWQDIYVTIEKFQTICKLFGENFYDFLLNINRTLSATLSYDDFNSIKRKISMLTQIQMKGEPYPIEHEVIYQSTIIDILEKILEKNLILNGDSPEWLNRLYLQMTYYNYVTLSSDDIIKKTGFSSGYISSMFKKYYNITFNQYNIKTKLMYSVSLLGKMKIIEIAQKLGWENPKNYSIEFQRLYGISPKKYELKLKTTNRI